VDVIMGVRFRTGRKAWIDGLEVGYRVGGQRYVGRFPASFALCYSVTCHVPDMGPPWGPT
jgi:hypothetical protein